MLFEQKPDDFNPRFEITSCFVEYNGKILLLHRQDDTPQEDTWGVPAGKIKGTEPPLDATIREIGEETRIQIPASQLSHYKTVFVRYPEYDFVYHMFHAKFDTKPSVKLNPKEHKDYKWATPSDTLGMKLIMDLDACIKMFYN